jgi:hypothetical protein
LPKKSIWDDPAIAGVAGLIVGSLAGEYANKAYSECTDEERQIWREKRIMHHGELGAFATIVGAGLKSPFWTGAGVGLMISDLDDADEWFKKKPNQKDIR